MREGCCAVCGGMLGDTLLVHDQPDRFERHVGVSEQGYHRVWLRCNECGSATNQQAPENRARLASLAADYYEVDLANSSVAEKYTKVMNLPNDKSDNAGRVERIRKTLQTFHERLPAVATRERCILDIGAGTGVFLSRFLDQADEHGEAWRAVGVEPDPNAARHLISLNKFSVHQGLYKGQSELCGFDLVTLNKVVEHIPEPVSFVTTAGLALSEEAGIFYVEVPDVLTIGRRPPTDNILGALHHHLYTPLGIVALFRRAGLACLDVGRAFEPSGKLTVFGFATSVSVVDALCGEYS